MLYRLREGGFQAFLVGGCVRDLLLGLEPKDFDVATDALPEEVKRLFRNCRLVGGASVWRMCSSGARSSRSRPSAPPAPLSPGEEPMPDADLEEGEVPGAGGASPRQSVLR